MRRAAALSIILLSSCQTIDGAAPPNLAAYCTAENAFRVGVEGRAYYGVCPKEAEPAFLAGLERGRALRPSPPTAWPYFERMQQIEPELRAASSDAQRANLRERLRETERWAVHLINDPASYANN